MNLKMTAGAFIKKKHDHIGNWIYEENCYKILEIIRAKK